MLHTHLAKKWKKNLYIYVCIPVINNGCNNDNEKKKGTKMSLY